MDLPSNPSQASLADYVLSSETNRSIFKNNTKQVSTRSQNRSLKFKDEEGEQLEDNKKSERKLKPSTSLTSVTENSEGQRAAERLKARAAHIEKMTKIH